MSVAILEAEGAEGLPVDGTVHELLGNLDVVVLALVAFQARDSTNGLAEQAVCYTKHIRLVDDGKVL